MLPIPIARPAASQPASHAALAEGGPATPPRGRDRAPAQLPGRPEATMGALPRTLTRTRRRPAEPRAPLERAFGAGGSPLARPHDPARTGAGAGASRPERAGRASGAGRRFLPPASPAASPSRAAAPASAHPVRSMGTLHALRPEQINGPLDAAALAAIVGEAKACEGLWPYSTLAMALCLVGHVRARSAEGSDAADFAAHAPSFHCGGTQLVDQGAGGTCLTFAEALVERLQQRHGVRALAVSQPQPLDPVSQWPALTRDGYEPLPAVRAHMEQHTHVQLVVPYRHEQGVRLLIVEMGMGVASEVRDVALDAWRKEGEPGTILQAPSVVACRALWGRYRLHIKRPLGDEIFGIDLVRGVMFCNGAAMRLEAKQQASLAEARPGSPGTLASMRGLRAALEGAMRAATSPVLGASAPPSPTLSEGAVALQGEHAFDFAAMCTSLAGADAAERQAQWRSCVQYLLRVRRLFELPSTFVADMLYLVRHHGAYLEAVVHPRARVLQACAGHRDRAVRLHAAVHRLRDALGRPEAAHGRMGAIVAQLSGASAAVQAGDGAAAAAHYDEATRLGIEMAHVLVPLAGGLTTGAPRPMDGARAAGAQDAVGRVVQLLQGQNLWTQGAGGSAPEHA